MRKRIVNQNVETSRLRSCRLENLERRLLLTAVQWEISEGGNGHFYEAVLAPTTWSEAELAARERGGHLATISSAAENDFVFELVDSPEFWTGFGGGFCCSWGPWLGGRREGNGFRWITDEPFSYSNWLPGEPNNSSGVENSLHFFADTTGSRAPTWNDFFDLPAWRLNGYVVEFESPAVINVVTHGFNPTGRRWEDFREDFQIIGDELESLPEDGTLLDSGVRSHVTEWESAVGWHQAIVSMVGGILSSPTSPAMSSMLSDITASSMELAGGVAHTAARDVVRALETDLLKEDIAESRETQRIHLIGHGRGAVVNALAAEMLHQDGYCVAQYTSLDGYGTDWPGLSGVLGDLDIATIAEGERKVNYRVQQPLNGLLADYLHQIPATEFLSPREVSEVSSRIPDWRAPDRPEEAGFENIVLEGHGTGDNATSNHLNVTELFLRDDYLRDNFVGRNASTPIRDLTPPASCAEPAMPTVPPGDGIPADFIDGAFTDLGEKWDAISEASSLEWNSEFLDHLFSDFFDARGILKTNWWAAGNTRLVSDGGNTLVELAQAERTTGPGQPFGTEPASLGQPFVFDERPHALHFDFEVLQAGPGDRLEITYRDMVLDSIPLSSGLEIRHVSVEFPGDLPDSGMLVMRLDGPTRNPAKVRLDNLAIESLLEGDTNRDGIVNLVDFNALKIHFGVTEATREQGDLNGDRMVDLADFDLLKANFGATRDIESQAMVARDVTETANRKSLDEGVANVNMGSSVKLAVEAIGADAVSEPTIKVEVTLDPFERD